MNQKLPKLVQEALARQAAGDPHPSPDALTAFVEHSLPARENRRITDHLAKCADCREVVFLASSALEEPVGEQQEWMPAAAVPRISPALLAKPEVPPNGADAASVGASPRRAWTLRWAWVPVVAVVVLVSAVLVRRSEFIGSHPRSASTIASKEPTPAPTGSQQAPAIAPQTEAKANPAAQKSLAKSVRAQTKPARTSDVLPSALVASKASEQYPPALPVAAAPKSLGLPAPDGSGGVYKAVPGAVPRQNSFVESEAQGDAGLAAGSQSAPGKSADGSVPGCRDEAALAGHRGWPS